MRFNGICIISKNVRQLRDFYANILQTTADGEDVFVLLKTEGAELSIFSYEGMEKMAPGCMKNTGTGSYTLEFEVDDFDHIVAKLSATNTPIVKPPTTQPWGRKSIWAQDPDGNIVNFYTQTS
jgi:uncharacterized glyoxalase superfamily protein PhnB